MNFETSSDGGQLQCAPQYRSPNEILPVGAKLPSHRDIGGRAAVFVVFKIEVVLDVVACWFGKCQLAND